jgi:hypothetical protein
VPRPAMFVEMVTAPLEPAWAMISASRLWFLAFRTLCSTPALVSSLERTSVFSTDTVPTSTGWPAFWQSMISRITARNLAASFL